MIKLLDRHNLATIQGYSFLLPGPAKNYTAMPISGNTNTPKIQRIFSAPDADDCRILMIAKISSTNMSKPITEAMLFSLLDVVDELSDAREFQQKLCFVSHKYSCRLTISGRVNNDFIAISAVGAIVRIM